MNELARMPVVDVHAHAFAYPGEMAANEFVDSITFAGGSPEYMQEAGLKETDALTEELQRNKRNTVYFHYLTHELADVLDCGRDVDKIVQSRNEAISSDYKGYVKRLYDECGLVTMVTDFGFPQPPIDVSQFISDMPIEVVPIYRVEPLIAKLIDADCGWDEFRRLYDEAISEALSNDGYRGLKSIIAYRTGLDISPLSRTADQGLQALDAIRRGTGGGAMKKLRDHLLCRAMELCMEHDVPMQIHVGMGDHEVNLSGSRPALLMDLLRFPTFRACHVLLVHAGYPYQAEAGYMAHVLPRVYCDLSEGLPFAGNAAKRIIAETLEMAPITKVVYGSDGFGGPEIAYVAAKLGKRALSQALDIIVDEGMLSMAEANRAKTLILSENARQLYGLVE